MGKLYRFTLEEYKEMKRELDALGDLYSDVVGYSNEFSSSIFAPAYVSDLETWKKIVKDLEGPWAGWQGEDADAYIETAKEIIAEFEASREEMKNIMRGMEDKMNERMDELLNRIYECEELGNMTLGGMIAVQGAELLGIEVE